MFVNPALTSPNSQDIDTNLRPTRWDNYLGQEKIKNNTRIIIEAAKKRRDPLEHLLFYGNSGLGKTTLAGVIAEEMGKGIQTCAGPSLERAGDLASILTNLADGEILFVDECHRINKSVIEMLYSAMEDFKLHIVLGKGPLARTMELGLPHFTLIAATTRVALLPAPFRNRFGAIFHFDFYELSEIEQIIARSASILNLDISEGAIRILASRSRLTPRMANRLLKRVRDVAVIEGDGSIAEDIAHKALALLEIDEYGLEVGDRKILLAVIEKFSGGPVGIQSLAAAVSEEQETILDIYEPYLLQLGFIERTPRGRVATAKAHKHMGISKNQQEIL